VGAWAGGLFADATSEADSPRGDAQADPSDQKPKLTASGRPAEAHGSGVHEGGTGIEADEPPGSSQEHPSARPEVDSQKPDPPAPEPSGDTQPVRAPDAAHRLQAGTVWKGKVTPRIGDELLASLTILERDGTTFRASFLIDASGQSREVSGTINGEQIEWQADEAFDGILGSRSWGPIEDTSIEFEYAGYGRNVGGTFNLNLAESPENLQD
jgi:hypothetical protein